jgi:hypothetical protein
VNDNHSREAPNDILGAADGASVAIGVADEERRAGALMLPAECLRALMITLPEMTRQALRLQHGNPSLRLVYQVAGWEVESSMQPGTFIVTLRTPDGFHLSYALTAKDLRDIGEAAPAREGKPNSGRYRNQMVH